MRPFSAGEGLLGAPLAILDNPIWRREWRTRWRDGRAMFLVFVLVTAFALLLVQRYGTASRYFSSFDERQVALTVFITAFWRMIAWSGTVVALVIAPALSASAIAFERERGLLESVQLSPLRPLQIVVGKWLSSLAFLLLLWVAVLPISLLLLFLGVPSRQFWLVLGWHLLTLGFASGLGIACSAWAQRAHFALRTTYGFLLLWILSTFAAAYVAGETTLPAPLGWNPTFVTLWWGRLNPILAALDLISPVSIVPKWPFVATFMLVLLALCLWVAAIAVKRPLDQSPFIEARNRPKKPSRKSASAINALTDAVEVKPSLSHMTVPLLGDFYFQNPVLGREVRSKFRMRQPPLIAILIEIVLALVVAGFYLYIFGLALLEPAKRPTIFYGVAITALIVTALSCGVMGANGFSREREGGTWEGVLLSLLSARQILWGKLYGSLITCALFSLPVWPLLLVSVRWNTDWVLPLTPLGDGVSPVQLAVSLLIWAGSMPFFTLLGLCVGRRKTSSAHASGMTLGYELVLLLGLPILLFLMAARHDWGWMMGLTNPLAVLMMSAGPAPRIWIWATGVPYFLTSLLVSFGLWLLLLSDVKRELNRKAPLGRKAP